MNSEFAGTPLAVGTVKGRRKWNVDHLGRLRGITYPAVWLPGENVATCGVTSSPYINDMATAPHADEQIPKDACGCGFWAYHAGGGPHKDVVGQAVGIIEGYGRTIIGTKGFRSQKARVVAIVLPASADPERMSLLYPDVRQFITYDEMVAEHPLDDFRANPETHADFWTRELANDYESKVMQYLSALTSTSAWLSANSGYSGGGVMPTSSWLVSGPTLSEIQAAKEVDRNEGGDE